MDNKYYYPGRLTWDDVNLVQNLFIEDIETFGWQFGKEKNATVFSEGVA